MFKQYVPRLVEPLLDMALNRCVSVSLHVDYGEEPRFR
jgi:hypothetical protein